MTSSQALTLIDTHCHLDAPGFASRRAGVLQEARQAGVTQIVVPAVSATTFRDTLSMQQQYACLIAFGLHPVHIRQHQEQHLELLDTCLTRYHPVALGEIGLDAWIPDPDLPRQEALLVAQLKLAIKHALPVIVHCRRAHDRLLGFLRRYPVKGGFIHAFNGSAQQAEMYIRLGFKLGFGGAMTFEGSRRIRQLASTLPLEALVLETDAPDMRPAWDQTSPNHPANIARYAQLLAQLRNTTVEEIALATTRNAMQALQLP
jgi:TatD DNase family protein